MSRPSIRPERPGDAPTIHALTAGAFAAMSRSDGTEPAIIDRLRADGDLTLSLVAEEGGAILGHVAFSPVLIGTDGGWYGLGPVAVRPDRQRRGIGSALIEDGLGRLREKGAKGCALIGDPGYYARFGFRSGAGLRYGDVPQDAVQALPFGGPFPAGTLRYRPAFGP